MRNETRDHSIPVPVECPHCEHKWKCNGIYIKIQCPKCRKTLNIEENRTDIDHRIRDVEVW